MVLMCKSYIRSTVVKSRCTQPYSTRRKIWTKLNLTLSLALGFDLFLVCVLPKVFLESWKFRSFLISAEFCCPTGPKISCMCCIFICTYLCIWVEYGCFRKISFHIVQNICVCCQNIHVVELLLFLSGFFFLLFTKPIFFSEINPEIMLSLSLGSWIQIICFFTVTVFRKKIILTNILRTGIIPRLGVPCRIRKTQGGYWSVLQTRLFLIYL